MSVQFGESLTGDFEERTWTFEMTTEFTLKAGEFAIVPIDEYKQLLEKPSFNGELILTLESKNEWVRKVPRHLPEKNYLNEHFIWIDANGNTLVMGEDFAAAEKINSFPVKVYRHIRVKQTAERLET